MSWRLVLLTSEINERFLRMNVDVISTDVGMLPGPVGAEYSTDQPAVDGTDLYAFDALMQQLNAAITEICPPDTAVVADEVADVVLNDDINDVVDSATVSVTQPDDAPVAETRDRDGQSSLTAYSDTGPEVLPPPVPVTLHLAPPVSNEFARELPVNRGQRNGPDVLPTSVPVPVRLDQAQPDSSVFARQLPVPAAPDRGAVPTTVPVDTTSAAEIMSVDGRGKPVALPTHQPEWPILSCAAESGEPPTIPLLTASGSSGAEVRSTLSPADATASLKATPPPLPEMLIAGGQYHAKAVAHLPNLGTVQVEMTRASASEVAVHVHAAQALTVATLERSSATLQHLIASTIQPATMATEAAITEASYGSEPGIKIAMSLTSQHQSHADSRAFQPQGQSSRPEVVPVTLPERVASVTSLVDLLV